LLWDVQLGKNLSKRMLTVGVDVLVRNVMDDFAGDVDKRDVVGLGDVEDGVAGAVGESSHADVQAVIVAFNVIVNWASKSVTSGDVSKVRGIG
jgi:hypothetical protein